MDAALNLLHSSTPFMNNFTYELMIRRMCLLLLPPIAAQPFASPLTSETNGFLTSRLHTSGMVSVPAATTLTSGTTTPRWPGGPPLSCTPSSSSTGGPWWPTRGLQRYGQYGRQDKAGMHDNRENERAAGRVTLQLLGSSKEDERG